MTGRTEKSDSTDAHLDRALWERTLAGTVLDAAPVEQYRILAHTLERADPPGQHRVLVVTSALPGEGKTLTATNLAMTLSGSYRRRVLLIDADMRRPRLHQVYGPGGVAPAHSSQHEQLPDGLHLPFTLLQASTSLWLLAQEGIPDPIRVLASPDIANAIAWARTRFDWVIIDTPPAALVPDAKMLAELADGVLFVVWSGVTPHQAARRAVVGIGEQRIVGVVLNRVPSDIANGSLQYYGAYSR